jgi:hypothetical protein
MESQSITTIAAGSLTEAPTNSVSPTSPAGAGPTTTDIGVQVPRAPIQSAILPLYRRQRHLLRQLRQVEEEE